MNAFNAALRPALRALVAALTVALAAIGLSVVAAPVNAAETSKVMSMSSGTYESRVQYWINVRRSHHGLGKLRIQSCTDGTAERWADFLATNDEFYHQDMGYILDKCNAYYAGETLGRGAISPKRLVYLWMHSPAHRIVLLSPHARRIGIGAYPDRLGEWVVAADFMRF